MKMNDGASADLRVDRAFVNRTAKVLLEVGDDGEHIMSVNDACRLLEVLYGYVEETVVNCKRPLMLRHSVAPVLAYMLYRAVDFKQDELLAVIRPHEAIWLKLRLEQTIASCN